MDSEEIKDVLQKNFVSMLVNVGVCGDVHYGTSTLCIE